MARIKIKDLPKDKKISREEMKKVLGGFNPQPDPPKELQSWTSSYYTRPDTMLGTDVNVNQR